MQPWRNSECVRVLLVFDFNSRSMPSRSPTVPSSVSVEGVEHATVRLADIVPGSQQRGARGVEHGVVGAVACAIGIAMFQQDAGGFSRLRGLGHQVIHAHKRIPSRAMLRNRVGFVCISGCSHSSIQIGSGVMLTPVSSSTS